MWSLAFSCEGATLCHGCEHILYYSNNKLQCGFSKLDVFSVVLCYRIIVERESLARIEWSYEIGMSQHKSV